MEDFAPVTEQIARLERVAQREAGRAIGPLAAAARGGLLSAASAIAGDPASHVAFVTGCFVPRAAPPACETDGPVGAALAAAALRALGVPARLVTDARCGAVVRAAAGAAPAAGGDTPGAALPVHVGDEPGALARELGAAGVTHVVFCERLGPGADGVVRNMHGDDVTAVTAPLHTLAAGPWTASGIGDGGNEVGMGALAPALLAAALPHGERIRCAVACDHLIVAGISNWGAIALALAVGLLRGEAGRRAPRTAAPGDAARAATALAPAAHDAVLAAAVRAGAVDGVLARRSETVDGLAPADQRRQLAALLSACV
ncbi:MAG TPA: glutamate cyclase domain-containing protein [Conexibacter sp.]|nr:glutamate cyclase domain-containing protein [Conexibacter sp.]